MSPDLANHLKIERADPTFSRCVPSHASPFWTLKRKMTLFSYGSWKYTSIPTVYLIYFPWQNWAWIQERVWFRTQISRRSF